MFCLNHLAIIGPNYKNIKLKLPYVPAYKTHRPIRRTLIFCLEIFEKIILSVFNFSNLLEENRNVAYEN
jgi:hypothetical protein